MIFRTLREELLGQKIALMYFGTLEVTLEVYDVNKNISDGVVVLMNHVRTPRSGNSILCILRNRK